MISLTIEDKNIENIFLKEFDSNKKEFFNFIQNSFDKLKNNNNTNLINLQISSMSKTWDNNKDKAWDEL